MPTSIATFANSEFRMRFREPYVTEGLNAKLAVNTPPGTYRGFRLATHASNDTITVVADADALDHVAIYQTSDGYSLTLRKSGGNYAVDLSTLVDASEKTWVIAIYAEYAVGSTTAARLQAYEYSPVDEFTSAPERDELVVLGMVTIPAGGGVPIPAGNVVHDKRTFGWFSRAEEAVGWSALLRNGGFEFSWEDLGGDWEEASAFWWRETTAGDAYWETNSTEQHWGEKALGWLHQGTASSGSCAQDLNIPLTPGQLLRYRFYKKALQVSTAGNAYLSFNWLQADAEPTTATTVEIDLSGVDADYVEVSGVVAAPSGARYLGQVAITNVSVNFGLSTTGYVVDDIQVWIEAQHQENDQVENRIGSVRTTEIVLHDRTSPGGLSSAQFLAGVRYDGLAGQAGIGAIRIYRPGGASSSPGPALIGAVSNTGGDYTLIREMVPFGEKGYREYVSPTGSLVRTVNAQWSNVSNLWTKDVNGEEASRFEQGPSGEDFLWQTATVNSWADGAWTRTVMQLRGTDTSQEVIGQERRAVLVFKDEYGSQKTVFDHQGLFNREYVECSESWLDSSTAKFSFYNGTGNGVFTIEDANTDPVYSCAYAQITTNTAGGLKTGALSLDDRSLKINKTGPDGTMIIAEWWASLPVGGTANDMDAFMGIDAGGASLTSVDAFGFRKLEANSTWHVAGGGVDKDTGITVSSGDWRKFRMELYNSVDPIGNERRCLFYIDGILRQKLSASDMSGGGNSESRIVFATRDSGATGNALRIGQFHMYCNPREYLYSMKNA